MLRSYLRARSQPCDAHDSESAADEVLKPVEVQVGDGVDIGWAQPRRLEGRDVGDPPLPSGPARVVAKALADELFPLVAGNEVVPVVVDFEVAVPRLRPACW